jgi:hypothetical protein
MQSAHELQAMINKFPTYEAKIIQLYLNDLNFKSLCEDFWLSTNLLTRYKKNVESDLMLENEYHSICSLLEKEVMDYLQTIQPYEK